MKPKVSLPWGILLWVQLNIASASWLIYYNFFEKSYLSYSEEELEVMNPGRVMFKGKIVPYLRYGELLHLKFTRCNSDDVPHTYTIGRNMLIDGERKILEPGERMIDPGCAPVNRYVPLPAGTPASGTQVPGPMYGFAQTIGTLKTHIVRWKSQPFMVLPSASAASQ